MSFVGKSVERKDALDKVLGRAKYIDDFDFVGTLIAKGVYSTEAHARLKSVDISEAAEIDGVIKIITAKDIPGENKVPVIFNDMPFLAEDVVRYMGEPIAWIAAETEQIAEEAAKKVKIEYEPLEAVLSIEESIKEGAPQINPRGNIHRYYKLRKGDVEKGFSEADLIIENELRTPYQEHSYIETMGVIAVPASEGGVTVYGSFQCPFYVLNGVSAILGQPMNKLRIVAPPVGGGFGGKEDMPSLFAGHAALLSWYTKRPVKLILTREEDIISSSKRHPSLIKYKTGVKKDGTLVAVEAKLYLDGGAYSTLSPVVAWRGLCHALGPYKCENVKIDSYGVATNLVTCGAFRGFGTPQAVFAHEVQMDIVAHKLGIDQAEFRRINALREGDLSSTNQKMTESIGLVASLDAALEKCKWKEKLEEYSRDTGDKRRGIGLATAFYGVGLGAGGKKYAKAGAYVEVNRDASVAVAVGTTEIGQGMKTVLCQIAADALGVPYDNVYIVPIDTARVPDSGPTVASRTTVMSGNAIIDACRQLREDLDKIAEDKLGIPAEDLVWSNGEIYFRGNSEVKITFKEIINKALDLDVHLARQGWFKAPYTSFDEETGMGWCYFAYAFSTTVAEVEVDIKTGEVTVFHMTAAHDVGKAVNPQLVEGQIEGGTVQSLGYGLTEDLLIDEKGKIMNPSFSTYIIPTAVDAPKIDALIVEHTYPKGPFGAKGFGELPAMGPGPAILNAVFNATGVRMKEIPITPERFLKAKNNM